MPALAPPSKSSSHPSTHNPSRRSRHLQAIRPRCKICLVDFLRSQLFDTAESKFLQEPIQFFWPEKQSKWFSRHRHSSGKRGQCHPFHQSQRSGRNRIVKSHAASFRKTSDESKCLPRGVTRQIGHYSQPREKCSSIRSQSRLFQLR